MPEAELVWITRGVEPFGKQEEKATLYHSGQGSK